MRILISTFGTRGDIQPFIALAQTVVGRGHSAAICTAAGYRTMIESAGVDYLHMGNDMLQLIQDAMPQMSGPHDTYKIFRSMGAAQRAALQDEWAAAQEYQPTLIVFHPKSLGGYHIAEKLGVPAVLSLPLPFFTPTREFPIPFLHHSLGGLGNRSSYQFVRVTALAYGGMINQFRGQLGLRPIRRTDPMLHDRAGRPLPILYPFSRHVCPVPADYPSHVHVTGYWPLGSPDDWQAPPDLERFLLSGPAPIYVGFGSMGFGRGADQRYHAIIDAVRRTGCRAIINSGWTATNVDPGGDDILLIDDAPHDWLFPRVAAVVHHGGSGTAAAGLRAGRPTLICPVLGDQPFWADQVHRRGAGPAPLPWRKLTADTLAPRLHQLTTTPRYQQTAAAIAQLLAGEDGPATATAILETIAPTS